MIFFVKYFLLPALAFAHGESHPGPHGGIIRMPGPFHTEILIRDHSIEVFLLDINIKSPMVAKSTVHATLEQNRETKHLNCKAMKQSFVCIIPPGVNLQSGRLLIKAKRGELQSTTNAVYDLPLI